MTLPSGTVTFVFTDIEGSTRLLQELGDEYGDVVSAHRRIIREAFGAHDGTEMDTQGDAFFFSFARARAAVDAAVSAQRALRAHAWPGGREVRVRMGLHTGEPTVGDEGYIGLDVVRAARICSAGHGGQILLSETTRALVGNQLPEGASVHDLGEAHLKDIQHEHVYQLSVDGGPSEFPPLKSAEPETTTESWGVTLSKQIQEKVRQDIERSFADFSPSAEKKSKKRFGLFRRP
jgi:class 3 adenylate cyclase